MQGPEHLATEFVARINRHDVQALVALCTLKHRFIDSLGNVVSGHEQLKKGWLGYFAMFPDYHVRVEHSAVAGNLVLMTGWASGSRGPYRAATSWKIPAAWRAVVEDEKISEWQVYADNKPVHEILQRDA